MIGITSTIRSEAQHVQQAAAKEIAVRDPVSNLEQRHRHRHRQGTASQSISQSTILNSIASGFESIARCPRYKNRESFRLFRLDSLQVLSTIIKGIEPLGIERRRSVRKNIRMACTVMFPTGLTVNGNTKNISLTGVEVETTSTSGSNSRPVAPGDPGLLTLKFRRSSGPDSLMSQCQVVHLLGGGMGLSARFSDLSTADQEVLGKIIASGRPIINDEDDEEDEEEVLI